MAQRVWSGAAADGNFGTAGNWSGATAPATNDTVVFDTGNVSVTAGLDQSAVDVTNLIINRGYTGNIGTSGSSLLIGVNGKMVIDGGGAALYLGTGGTYDWNDVIISYPGSVNGYGLVSLAGTGGIAKLSVNRGNVYVTAGTTARGVLNSAQGSSANLFNDGATFTVLDLASGSLTQNSGTITTLRQTGGASKIVSGTTTNIVQFGGIIVWNSTTTITSLIGYTGHFDGSQIARARTITTAEGNIGFAYALDDNVAVTNDYLNRFGATRLQALSLTSRA